MVPGLQFRGMDPRRYKSAVIEYYSAARVNARLRGNVAWLGGYALKAEAAESNAKYGTMERA